MASKRRWSERQEEKVAVQENWQNELARHPVSRNNGNRPPCPERTLKTPLPQQSSSSSRNEENQWVVAEERRRRRIACEETAWGILAYLEDSEDLKVGVTELQEQLGISEEAGKVAWQARNENSQFFEIF